MLLSFRGSTTLERAPQGQGAHPLRKIDSVVISEVLGTLAEIASKRK